MSRRDLARVVGQKRYKKLQRGAVINAVNFRPNLQEMQPRHRPLERDMGCLLWVQAPIYILSQSWQ